MITFIELFVFLIAIVFSIFIWIGIIKILTFPFKRTTNINNEEGNIALETKNQILNNEENCKNYYEPKIYLTTLNELTFYNILLEIAQEINFTVFSQVALNQIIKVKKGLNKSKSQTAQNKIDKRSIDFVLVDKRDCRIRTCIELDDSSHYKYKNRIERDKFVNKLFKDLNIHLIRYPASYHYNKEDIKNKILQNSDKIYY